MKEIRNICKWREGGQVREGGREIYRKKEREGWREEGRVRDR